LRGAGCGAHQQRRPRPRLAPPPRDARPLSCFRVSCLGIRDSGFGFRDSDFRFRLSGLGFPVSTFGLRDSTFGFRVSRFHFRVSGSGFRAQVLGVSPVGRGTPILHVGNPPQELFSIHIQTPHPLDDTPFFCFRDSGFGIRLLGFGIRLSGFKFRVYGSGFRMQSRVGRDDPLMQVASPSQSQLKLARCMPDS